MTEAPIAFLLDSGSTVDVIRESVIAADVMLERPRVRISTLAGPAIHVTGSLRDVEVRDKNRVLENTQMTVTPSRMNGLMES